MPSRFRLRLTAGPGQGHVVSSRGAGEGAAPHPADWPFLRRVTPERIASALIHLPDLHLAFPSGQTQGTRLVLTQSTYQVQRWLDWLDANPDVSAIADADRVELERRSPETFAGRGPWSRVEIVDVKTDSEAAREGPPCAVSAGDEDAGGAVAARRELHDAFVQPDPAVRLDVCRRATDLEPDDAALLLAYASTCMELQLLDDAKQALAHALALAPDWEAVHFERGKLLLRLEETEQAALAFAEAARLMPTFAAAYSNLGAALGELERPAAALDALTRALDLDPRGHPILNNIGAVHRDEGRLDDAEAAFRQVIAIAPGFVFGRYNLAHTLLLKGEFAGARAVYEEAFARDPQKNARQACRLAVARAAAGDADGAIALLLEVCGELPPEGRQVLLEETESTLTVLSQVPGVDADTINRVRAASAAYSS